ncbi:hypothetical protein GGD62_008275 [Bradyrhizobium sp. ERR14]|nr:hypothetical protein [Bradyrhizobium sp. ERR14]
MPPRNANSRCGAGLPIDGVFHLANCSQARSKSDQESVTSRIRCASRVTFHQVPSLSMQSRCQASSVMERQRRRSSFCSAAHLCPIETKAVRDRTLRVIFVRQPTSLHSLIPLAGPREPCSRDKARIELAVWDDAASIGAHRLRENLIPRTALPTLDRFNRAPLFTAQPHADIEAAWPSAETWSHNMSSSISRRVGTSVAFAVCNDSVA